VETRTLGNTDLQVSRLGFGAARIGEGVASDRLEELFNTLLDMGGTFIDTADCYVDSEALLGRILGRRLRECVVATKCGCLTGGAEGVEYSRPVIADSIDRSLRRLGVDQLDLVMLHTCSAEVLRAGEAAEALLEAKAAGKVRYTGYSGDGEDALQAISMDVFDALQVTFNVISCGALADVLPAARQAGMGVIAKRPIANARLVQKNSPHFHQAAYWDAVRQLPDADGLWEDPLELSLRYTLSHDCIDTAIVGTNNPQHARDNVRRAVAGALPVSVLEALSALDKAGG
tara:strand:- start:264 stop:1127 length:864 start_codon:yes stop_codon:yes gene_type:complete